MKNLTIILLVAIALISCKKEVVKNEKIPSVEISKSYFNITEKKVTDSDTTSHFETTYNYTDKTNFYCENLTVNAAGIQKDANNKIEVFKHDY